MSGRRANTNRIRGPQSALTDFLAANNISAAQIRDDYLRRQAEAPQPSPQPEDDENELAQAIVASGEKSKKRKRADLKAKIKLKAGKKQKKGGSTDDEDYDDAVFANEMYKKSKPPPGQLENCDVCNKRFTVTAYSKTGPEGGLVCTPCGRQIATDEKAAHKATKKAPTSKKRRKTESDRLDGIATHGSKTLQQLCIEKVADHHLDIEEFGDLPEAVLERLSEIFSKRRVLNPRTLKLFLRPDIDSVVVNDAAYLGEDDYMQIFAVVPKLAKLVLRNACQFKDPVLAYMLERATEITYFQVYGANLVSDEMWKKFFKQHGPKLETLKLEWLDASFTDDVVQTMVSHCKRLRRLKLKHCRKITSDSLTLLSQLHSLAHLSLQLSQPAEAAQLVPVITSLGPQLETLSLENCIEADDTVVDAMRLHCGQLSKFRLTDIDRVTDAAFEALFDVTVAQGCVPPLKYIDLSSARDVDSNLADGPEDAPVGLASTGFKALMAHSGARLERLHIASCRHIKHTAFCDVFNGRHVYPEIQEINLSFCNAVDSSVIMGIFKCCPKLKKLIAFGCFKILDVAVPSGIALIGVPRAQDAIEQFGNADMDFVVGVKSMGNQIAVGA